jgi:DNA-binding MarR family transcriptional regulator
LSSQVLNPQLSTTIDAWVGLLRAHAAAMRSLSAQLVAEHCLTINEYEALLYLARADGGRLRRVDLSHALLLTASGVTRLLDGLERSGFVEKATCASDARVTYAVLTPAGRAKFDGASCSHVAAIQAHFEQQLNPDEIKQLAALLQRLPGVEVCGQ